MNIPALIVLSMIAAGMLGGAVNFFLAEAPAEKAPEKPSEKSRAAEKSNAVKPLKWWQHLIIGVSAAFVVPVFLNSIGSNLIAEFKSQVVTADVLSKLLVLDGFCLLAAISSRAFIRSMSDFLLQQVKDVSRQVTEQKQDLDEAKKATTDVKKAVEEVKQTAEEKTQKIGELEDSLKEVKGGVEDARLLANIATDAPKVNTAPPPQKSRPMTFSDDTPEEPKFMPKRGDAPDDPWKGSFGGKPVDHELGRQLTAKVLPIRSQPGWYAVELAVSRLPGSDKKLDSPIQFFIHDTFSNPKPEVQPIHDKAVLHLKAWGAFTVGALTDDGTCKLELDLAELKDAPEEFRTR